MFRVTLKLCYVHAATDSSMCIDIQYLFIMVCGDIRSVPIFKPNLELFKHISFEQLLGIENS